MGGACFEAAADVRTGFVDAAKPVGLQIGASVEKGERVEAVGIVGGLHMRLKFSGLALDARLSFRIGVAGENGKALAAGSAGGAVVEGLVE